MQPILFHLGSLAITAYGFMLLVGFVAAALVSQRSLAQCGTEPQRVWECAFLALLAGLLGGRIFFAWQHASLYDWSMFAFWQGLTPAGGFWGLAVAIAGYGNLVGWLGPLLAFLALVGHHVFFAPQVSLLLPVLHLLFALYLSLLCLSNAAAVYQVWRRFSWSGRAGLIIYFALAILLGQRALFCYQHAELFDWSLFMLWKGGLSFYGGLTLASLVLLCWMAYHRLPLLRTSDALAPGVALGLAFTRVGCFLNGCCYGIPCSRDFLLGIWYPPHSLAGVDLHLRGISRDFLHETYGSIAALPSPLSTRLFEPVYPIQLCEALYALLLFALLWRFLHFRRQEGEVVLLLLILYALGRFFLEMGRADESLLGHTGLTINQLFSCGLFVASVSVFASWRMRPWLQRWLSSARENHP